MFALRKDERKLQYSRSTIGMLGFINTGYFTSDNVPDGIKNATHNTFSNFRKKLATEIKISKQQKIATEQIKTATRLELITFKIEKRKTKL
jgi:hypothetical protein